MSRLQQQYGTAQCATQNVCTSIVQVTLQPNTEIQEREQLGFMGEEGSQAGRLEGVAKEVVSLSNLFLTSVQQVPFYSIM